MFSAHFSLLQDTTSFLLNFFPFLRSSNKQESALYRATYQDAAKSFFWQPSVRGNFEISGMLVPEMNGLS